MTKRNTSIYLILYSIFLIVSCDDLQERQPIKTNISNKSEVSLKPNSQISEYIRHIFQDKNGNFWFGTNGYGVAHYDGDSVFYYSNAQGFNGLQITGITEDQENNLWFSTDQGIVKYNWSSNQLGGNSFTNFTDKQYFGGQRFWSIHADLKGNVWAGSTKGIFRFDGVNLIPFELPYPEELTGDFLSNGTSCGILEDRAGNIWFSTRGYGVFKYDGKEFRQYTEQDGLADNDVYDIFEDRNGNIWFGTMFGGLSCYDGTRFENFTQKNSIIGNNEICVIHEDKAGTIWFSSEGFGVYCYDGQSFSNFSEKQGLGVKAVQAIFEDREGRMWVGGGGGLYRYDGDRFVHVTKHGPWR